VTGGRTHIHDRVDDSGRCIAQETSRANGNAEQIVM